jgi:L-aminopeptidase/D-esterase-like protein
VAGGLKGGVGTASEILPSGITVGALVAVNASGQVINPATGSAWEIGLELEGEFGTSGRKAVQLPPNSDAKPARNTTIGVIATDAALDKAQAQKVAQMAHDGLARAIRPAHTLFDGDTIFCMATGERELPDTPGFFQAPKAASMNDVGRSAADTFARAIIHAVFAATSLHGYTAFKDLKERPYRRFQ